MPSPEAHSILSPSSAHRWIACPPSARKAALHPDTPSIYAEEGTEAKFKARLEQILEWKSKHPPKK